MNNEEFEEENNEKPVDVGKFLESLAGLVVSGGIFVIVLQLFFCSGEDENDKMDREAKRKIDYEVTVGEITQEFRNAEILAGKKYNGKRVRITGCLSRPLDGTYGESLYIYLEDCSRSSEGLVSGWTPPKGYDDGHLENLQKGRNVIMDCTIKDGGDWMGVDGEYCVVRSASDKKQKEEGFLDRLFEW